MFNLSSEFIDVWTKSYSKRLFKYSKVYLFKSKKWAKNLKKHDWKQELDNVEDTFYSSMAIRNNAPQNLPFSTLVLIGKNLQDQKYKLKMKKVIEINLLTTDGFVFQLDDQENQVKIRKALRIKNFSLPDEVKAA